MSKSVSSLDQITIATPCEADWDAMIGNDQVRFCEHCSQYVNNLSTMTRREAMRLVERSQGRLCVRFVQRTNGEVLNRRLPRKLHQIGRRASRLAAGAFSATLSVASAAAQQSSVRNEIAGRQLTVISSATPASEGARISGVVRDPNGAVVRNATVTLTNRKENTSFVFVTQDDGAYLFTLLDAGGYNLSVEANGFATGEKKGLNLSAAANQTFDVELTLPTIIAEVEVRSEIVLETSIQGGIGIREPSEPLVRAAFKNDLEAAKQLIPVTGDVNKWDEATNTNALSCAIERGNQGLVDLRLAVGASTNSSNKYGKTPLMYLSEGVTVELVHKLLAAGGNVNARDASNVTVLNQAVRNCIPAVIKELMAAGARIDARDDHGNTVLMNAAWNDDAAVARMLLAAGADVNAKNADGECAMSLAAKDRNGEMLKAMIEAGSALTLSQEQLDEMLLTAVEDDHPDIVEILIKKAFANPNAKDDDGGTPLMEAADNGRPETLKILIDAGADINAADNDGCTALMRADDVEKVLLLLNAGADATRRNSDGKTALGLAIERRDDDIVKLLKSRGAPP